MHCSPAEYIGRLRLERAKELLLTDASIKEVALGAGFGSDSYFCKKFKRELGYTPSEYRRYVRDEELPGGNGAR